MIFKIVNFGENGKKYDFREKNATFLSPQISRLIFGEILMFKKLWFWYFEKKILDEKFILEHDETRRMELLEH